MGGGASRRLAAVADGDDALALHMPASLPPAYICIYCSDVMCRCRCLYCGERGHSTKLCARRAQHAAAPQEAAAAAAAEEEAPKAAAAAATDRVYVHVRYTRAVDEQRSHVAAKVIQCRWRGRVARQRNRVCAPLRTPDEMARLSLYGIWVRRTRWRLLAYEPEPACVVAVTRIQSVERGAQCRRRRGELTRQASLAKLHCQIWQIKKWAAEPTDRWSPIEPAVAVGLSVEAGAGGGPGGAEEWVRLALVVAPELLRRSEEERYATVIQKHYRGWLARKWHGMMDAMMMLPGQGGVDAAVEKYGFRIIGLLQELQHREAKLGADHTDTADVRYNMGRLYQQHGDFDQALKSFNHALSAYTTNLGTAHPKSANLLYCIALIYKERAESGLEAEARKEFDKVDADGSGVVTMEELEPLLGKLFDDVDLSLCSGPQTVVALLLEVFEAEDSDGSGTLGFEEFVNVFRRCLLVIAQGYFETAARSFEAEYGADYEFAIEARSYAEECAA